MQPLWAAFQLPSSVRKLQGSGLHSTAQTRRSILFLLRQGVGTWVALLATLCAAAAAPNEATLQILPASIELVGLEERQQLLAEATSGTHQEDWTDSVEWTSSHPEVVAVDGSGLVRPVSDGSAIITAKIDGHRSRVTVRVRGTQESFRWSFRNHIIPLLTKKGCNSGACHGALAGKNGFKLTLRGYDPEVDHNILTRESVARRVSLADPASSLVILKPTLTLPHGGGRRFEPDSLEYRILAEWIAAGAPAPKPDDPEVVGLEVYPKSATLQLGARQRLVVRAKYSDGHVADVTRWAKYNSTDQGVASVDDSGLVNMNGHGETAITIWYSNQVLYARLTVPYPNPITEADFQHFRRKNYIDDLVLAKLKKLNIAPSHPSNDSQFLRRAYLDAAGILPMAAEVEEFLRDPSPDKREKWIDQLLERDEFVDYWAYKWSDLLLLSSRRLPKVAVWDFYNWIRASVKQNRPWDQFARDIFTASGSTRRNGALNYYVLHKDPIDLAENVTQAFMGQRLTCARCHNHPLEKWTQTQYYQFTNLFTRVGIKDGSEPGGVIVFAKAYGDINHPRLLRPLDPTPLDGEPISLDSTEDRRLQFAQWLTNPENPFFVRNLVSRVWANFFASGLVRPEDDLRATNPASNEELFDRLVEDFVAKGFDVKHLIRTIMNSGTYQLSSDPNATNQKDSRHYSRYVVKRLPAEVILDAMSQISGVPTAFQEYPKGMRALQLPDVKVESQFLEVFGRPPRTVCDVKERSSEPSIAQALHVINGDTLNDKLRAGESHIGLFVKLGLSDAHIVDHIYLSLFSRHPTDTEKRDLLRFLREARLTADKPAGKPQQQREALEDMVWALMTSKEFLFNQ